MIHVLLQLHPSNPLPVFVWIHGGGFIWGSSSTLFYGPDYIIEKDVIFVSFNYRLNIFGFLSFKDPKVGIPGNAGLKDQSMALKWIKENISHFGGDSNNITIVGESAGGASVHYHLISPLSKGLFNRAIVMSGSALTPWANTSPDYDKYLKKFAIGLGLTGNEDDMTVFRAINGTDADKLIQINSTLIERTEIDVSNELMGIFIPQVEPYIGELCFLPKPPLELGRDPWSKDIDVIFGGTANEGLLGYMFSPMEKQLEMMHQDNSLLLLPEMRKGLSAKEAHKKGQALHQLYFKSDSDRMSSFINLSTERQFWHAIHRSIKQRHLSTKGHGKTFVYYLCLEPSLDVPEFYEVERKLWKVPIMTGTCHTEDFPLLFKTRFAPRFKPGDDNYEAQQAFLNFFMDFARNGKMSNWPPLVKGQTQDVQCMEISRDKWAMTKLPNIEKLRVWDGLYNATDLI